MNQFDVDDLIVVERAQGASRFSRPDRERLSEWLTDYSLGELWEKNLIGGRPVTPEVMAEPIRWLHILVEGQTEENIARDVFDHT